MTMTNDELIKNIKALKGIKPRLEWVRATRQKLFFQIPEMNSGQVESQNLNLAQNELIDFVPPFQSRSIKTPYIENKTEFSSQSVIRKIFDIILPRPKLIWRFAAAFLILFSLSFVSLAKVSEKSLPGDNLYPLKLALEKTSFVFTFSNEEKSKLHTQLAERRLEEFTTLVKITDSSESNKLKSEKIKVVMDELKKELSDAKVSLEKTASQESRKKTISLAKTVEGKTVRLEETLTKAHEDLPASIKTQVKAALKETIELVDKTNLKALEILATKTSDENSELSSEEKNEVKILIEAKIKTAEGKIEAVNNSSSSPNVLSGQAQEALKEAKEYLNNEDLSGAVEKVAVSGQIIQVAEKIIDSSTPSAASSDTSITPESQNNTQAPPSNNSPQEQPTDSTNSSTNTGLTPADNKVLDNNSDNSNNTDNAPVTNNPQLRINLIE